MRESTIRSWNIKGHLLVHLSSVGCWIVCLKLLFPSLFWRNRLKVIKGEKSKISSLIHDLFLSIETHRFTKGNVYIFKEYNIIQVLINIYTKFQQYSFWHWRGGGVHTCMSYCKKRGPIPRWETKLLNQKLNYQKWNNDRYNNIQQKTEYL